MGFGGNYLQNSEQEKQQNYADTGSFYGRPHESAGKPYWAGAYQLGQDPNEYMRRADEYGALGSAADQRAAPVTNYTLANQSRSNQGAALSLLGRAARGAVPSAAEAQYQLGMNQAGANAGLALAGGGSPLALANASRMGATLGARDMSAAGYAAANARSGEQMRALQAYTQGGLGMRGQDIGQEQYDADLLLRSQQLNDARAVAYEAMRQRALAGQRDAYLQEQQNLARYGAVMSGQEQYKRAKRRQDELNLAGNLSGAGMGALMGAARSA